MSETSHKAASHTLREIASWQPGRGSADSDLLPELSTMVARSRDLSRNHGIAAGAMQTLHQQAGSLFQGAVTQRLYDALEPMELL